MSEVTTTNSRPLLLILVGESGAGKDSVADHFLPRDNPRRIALADRLRDIIRESLPIGRRDLAEDKDRPIRALGGITGRHAMRLVGAMMREVDPLVWARPVAARIVDWFENLEEPPFAMVTDIRDPADLDYIRSAARALDADVFAVRLVRRGVPFRPRHHYETGAGACNVDATILTAKDGFDAAAAELEALLASRYPTATCR